MEKEKVKNKIIKYCKLYNIKIPEKWNYEEVKIVSKKINKEFIYRISINEFKDDEQRSALGLQIF